MNQLLSAALDRFGDGAEIPDWCCRDADLDVIKETPKESREAEQKAEIEKIKAEREKEKKEKAEKEGVPEEKKEKKVKCSLQ